MDWKRTREPADAWHMTDDLHVEHGKGDPFGSGSAAQGARVLGRPCGQRGDGVGSEDESSHAVAACNPRTWRAHASTCGAGDGYGASRASSRSNDCCRSSFTPAGGNPQLARSSSSASGDEGWVLMRRC